MTTATAPETSEKQQREAAAPTHDAFARFGKLATYKCSENDYYRAVLTLIGQHFGAYCAAVDVQLGATNISHEYSGGKISRDLLQSVVDALLLETQSQDKSIARVYDGESGLPSALVLAAPIHHVQRGNMCGALAVAIPIPNDGHAQARLNEFTGLIALATAHQPRTIQAGTSSEKQTSNISRAMERAAKYGNVRELAFQLVNSVSAKFDCIQVSMGIAKRKKLQLIAISGMDKFSPSSPGVHLIQQAMDECFDARRDILFQQTGNYDDERGTAGHLLHKQWHQETGGNALLSVPLTIEDDIIAIISLQRDAKKPFSVSDVDTVKSMLQPFSPAIAMLQNRGSRIAGQAVEGFKTSVWANWARRASLFLALTAFGIWFGFGSINYHVAVPCAIAPAKIHHVVSPFEGIVAEHAVQPGDHVEAGELLLKLDTKDLELERSRLLSEISALRIQLNQAIAERQRSQASLAQADVDVLAVQLELVNRKLERAELRAPVAGVVIRGELSERIGQVVPQGEPLIEIGGDDGQYVELRIPEESAIHFANGNVGRFSAKARPDMGLDCEIRRIMPSAQVTDGTNVFLADAKLSETTDWMRVGMEGVAKINVGARPVWWVAFHRMIDKVRLYMWT